MLYNLVLTILLHRFNFPIFSKIGHTVAKKKFEIEIERERDQERDQEIKREIEIEIKREGKSEKLGRGNNSCHFL